VEVLERLVASCSEGDRKRASIALGAGLYNNNMSVRGRQEFDKLYTEYSDDGQVLIAEADALAENAEMGFLDERIRFWSERHIEDRDTLLVVAGKLAASENESARSTAERLLEAILQGAPNCAAAMQMLAMLLQSEGQSTESAEIYGRILEVEKDNVVVMNNLAWILCEAEHRYKEALELASDGMERAPEYTDLIDTCGVIYYRLGEHQQAVQELSRCVKMYPENSQALVASRFHLARALAALGEDKGAIENLEISLDMHDKVGGLSQSEVAEADSLRRALLEVQTNVTVTK
jgi:tetratricopeptide (TPR) repeat protein